jgi:hypothetical protein
VLSLSQAVTVQATYSFSCALLAELGNGTKTNSFLPVTVQGFTYATSLALGDSHACVTLLDGSVPL